MAQSKALLADTKARIAAIKQARRDAADLAKTTVALAEAEAELQSLLAEESESSVETGEVDYVEQLAHAG